MGTRGVWAPKISAITNSISGPLRPSLVFRILKILLFFAVLGGLYGLYQLHSTKQREQEVLAWSNRLIWDALATAATPRFGGQTVAERPGGGSWRVSGKLAAKTASGAPMGGDYQAIIVKRCSAAADKRCWELQALRVGDEVIVAGDGLTDDEPEPIAEPASPPVTAPADTTDTATAPEPESADTAGSDQSAAPVVSGAPATGNPRPSKQAEKAVVFGLPPPTVAGPPEGFSTIEPAEDAQSVASATDAAARLAMQLSPKAQKQAAPSETQAATAQPKADDSEPVPQMEAIPVAPVELGGTLEANTAPAAGQSTPEEPANPAPAAPTAAGRAITGAAAESAQTAALPPSEEPQPAARQQPAVPQADAPQAEAPQPQPAEPQLALETAAPARFDPSLVRQTQDRLLRLDYGQGRLSSSGTFDAATQDAILAYQYKNGLPGTGEPSYALIQHMDRFLVRLNAIASGQAAPTRAAASQTAYVPALRSAPPATNGYASFRSGLAAAERGQIDEAIAHYTRAIESTEWRERYMAYLARGNALAGQSNYRQAINDYSTAIKLRPDYAEAWINRGLAFAELAQREQALADLRQGQRLAPGSSTAARALRLLESRSQLE